MLGSESPFANVVRTLSGAAGCGRSQWEGGANLVPATPAELDRLGTKSCPGYSKDDGWQAALTALKVQGYDVVTAQPRIRTAPKLVHVSSSATYSETSGSAQSFAESVAWDIDITENKNVTTVHAVPRASVNGIPMDQMYYDYAERTFGQLMKELDASLPPKQ